MKRFWRLSVCNIFLAGILTGCSTPGTRGQAHAAELHRLSPADQHLVLHGNIRPGMSPEAVYIAWGSPDDKIAGTGKSPSETWVYRQRVTIYAPMNSYYYYGPYHGLGGGGPGQGFGPAYAYGGVGYEGTLRYQPHVRSLDSVRLAEFSGGKVDRFKDAGGAWSRPSPAAVALTVRPADRTLPHLASHTVHPDRFSRTARRAVHHGNTSAARHRLAVGAHRTHLGKHPSPGHGHHLQTAHASGSKAGMAQGGSSGHPPGHGVHGLGHTHTHSGTHHRPDRGAA